MKRTAKEFPAYYNEKVEVTVLATFAGVTRIPAVITAAKMKRKEAKRFAKEWEKRGSYFCTTFNA